MGSTRRTGATIFVSANEIRSHLQTGGTGGGLGGNGSGGGIGVGGAGLGGDGFSGIGAPFRESFSLHPFAVNLINAHVAAYEIPVVLIGETASMRGPGKLARGLWMIRIVNIIFFDSGIRRKRLPLKNQDGVVDGETGKSSKKADKQLPTRQGCVQMSVGLLLIPGARLKNHAGIADSEIAGPAMTDVQLHKFATRLAHFPQVFVARKNNSLILWQRLYPRLPACDSANADSQ